MNRIFTVCLIIPLVCFSVFSQNSAKKISATDFSKISSKDSHDVLQNPIIKSRLQNLLGKRSYADFMESWETVNPFVKKGNFLFSSGCLIHACGHAESAMAIDLTNKTIHTAIFREGKKVKYFNERRRKTPPVISNWARRLLQK